MSNKTEIFKDILSAYESEEIRNFCFDIVESLPQNFWSSATKQYDFAGGLVVQTLLGCMECNKILSTSNIEKQKKRDCIRAATLFRYIYPDILLAKRKEHDIKEGLKKYITNLIFNYKRGDEIEQTIINDCHYASIDSDITIPSALIEKIKEIAVPNPETYFFKQGTRYANMNFWLVCEMDKQYLYWLRDNLDCIDVEEPLRTYLRKEELWQSQ